MKDGRFHRTMQSAFGCYTNNELHPMPEQRPHTWGDAVFVVAVLICGVLGFLASCGG